MNSNAVIRHDELIARLRQADIAMPAAIVADALPPQAAILVTDPDRARLALAVIINNGVGA